MGNPHRVPFSAAIRIDPKAAPSGVYISQKAAAGNDDLIRVSFGSASSLMSYVITLHIASLYVPSTSRMKAETAGYRRSVYGWAAKACRAKLCSGFAITTCVKSKP
jgi:hypothetical protein